MCLHACTCVGRELQGETDRERQRERERERERGGGVDILCSLYKICKH